MLFPRCRLPRGPRSAVVALSLTSDDTPLTNLTQIHRGWNFYATPRGMLALVNPRQLYFRRVQSRSAEGLGFEFVPYG